MKTILNEPEEDGVLYFKGKKYPGVYSLRKTLIITYFLIFFIKKMNK